MDKILNSDFNVFGENNKDTKNDVVKDSVFYESAREKAMQDYLADVGPISQYINEQMEQITKDKSSNLER